MLIRRVRRDVSYTPIVLWAETVRIPCAVHIPLHTVFITDVDQLLKAIAATSQRCNVISI